MAKLYDVYGVGNALVDMEFEVATDYLTKSSIEKGLMTLVDEARQKEIISSLQGMQHKRSCGGSAANTMMAIAQFGGKSFYSCKVAKDEAGVFFVKDLVENGVDTNLSTSSLTMGVTGKCIVLITPDADRTMNTFLGITETLSIDELVEDHIINSRYLYVEGYLVASKTGKAAAMAALKLARQKNVKSALTFSDVNMVNYFNQGLLDMIGEGIDLLFCNEAEALAFTKTSTIDQAAKELKKFAKTFSITLGAKGAFVFDGEKEIHVLTMPVEAVDTNGAGDLYAGAFLYALNAGHTYSAAAKFGCSAASVLVTQFGPRLKLDQAREIKTNYLSNIKI